MLTTGQLSMGFIVLGINRQQHDNNEHREDVKVGKI
jgi:hypothetical protein